MHTTLVESSLPPRPTSIMAASTYEWEAYKWNISSAVKVEKRRIKIDNINR